MKKLRYLTIPALLLTVSSCTAAEVQSNAARYGITVSSQDAAAIAGMINSVESHAGKHHHRGDHHGEGTTTTTSIEDTTTTTMTPT